MTARNFVAIDMGAESGRALLGRLENGRLTLDEKHRFTNPTGRMNGHLYWDVLAQWEELKVGLRKAAAEDQHGHRATIHGVGVDTWGVDFGLLDRDGNVIGYPYHYRDRRTDGVMDEVFKVVPRKDLFAVTGLQFMQFNSLFQLYVMAARKDPVLEQAKTLLFMPDLFNYLFTGVARAESSIASTSQMIDPRTGQWATQMLERLNLPTSLLPPVVPAGTILGPLRSEVAEECGMEPVPVIAPAGHDTASAVAAVPVTAGDDAWCYISSGTWSLMGVELPSPLINEKVSRYNYTNEGGVGGTIRLLKNIMGLWLVQECRRHWRKEGYEHSYGELTQMAGRAHAFGPLINPDADPFAKPGEMPVKIDQFCRQSGQRMPATRSETVRCCLESLALTYRRTLEGLEDITGKKIRTIHIVGGGSQNELLNQMTADATGRTVVAGPIEATAIGNILVQAIATGDIKSLSEAREVVRASFDVKRYEPEDSRQWEEAYSRFQRLAAR